MDHAQPERTQPTESLKRAEVLIEALPWIKASTGKTVVIKYGGAAMVDEKLRADVVSDIVLMKIIGLNPIIVHGGGSDITDAMNRFGLPVHFENGMRITDDATMDVVKMVLVGKVNQELVAAMNMHGHLGVGLSGADATTIKAKQLDPVLGRVGEVTEIDTTLIEDLIASDYIPVIASVAAGDDGGAFNVNADSAAGEIAAAIGAQKVIFLTDVDGLYGDFSDKGSLISRLTLSEAEDLVASGTLSKGMIPKVSACVTALSAGVSRAHILNGTFPHALLLEIFTDEGVGTMIMRDDDELSAGSSFVEFPLGNLATKLETSSDFNEVSASFDVNASNEDDCEA